MKFIFIAYPLDTMYVDIFFYIVGQIFNFFDFDQNGPTLGQKINARHESKNTRSWKVDIQSSHPGSSPYKC
jgi:hypothetical protein